MNQIGPPFLQEGICVYCGDGIKPFSITPLMESEDGHSFHEMCESCADKHHPGWENDDEEDSYDNKN